MYEPVWFPTSFKQTRSLMKDHLTESVCYEICQNECTLYRDEHSQSRECPKCGEERRLDAKTYLAISIIPSLQNLFKSPSMTSLVKSHAARQEAREVDDSVFDIHDTEFWCEMYAEEGPLDGDAQNLLFTVSTDPVHPFKDCNPQYSMCPISLQILNFPKPLRCSDSRILLWTILPGLMKPKSLSMYLHLLVDELLPLKDDIQTFDADSDMFFPLKAMCVLNILDYESQQMFLDTFGPNSYQGYNKCRQPGVYLPILVLDVFFPATTRISFFVPMTFPQNFA